ncbi:MAG: HAMP domain-containing sensor histidine kinase [Chloroflexi bacterium]|nr:HAMP domain-containing sensor histidine kinase [Chloroflexota bacterium]
MFQLIRVRLALSFAAIAVFAVFTLGVVLLAILTNNYSSQEQYYLRSNVGVISAAVGHMMSSEMPQEEVQPLLENLAFLTQTRIQAYDLDQQLRYDSGPLQNVEVTFDPRNLLITRINDSNGEVQLSTRDTISLTPSLPLARVVVQGSLPNWPRFRLALNPAANADERLDFLLRQSALSITEPIHSGQDAHPLGTLVLSEGPAFGRAILMRVAWGWAFAGLLAVLLAALLGWYLSRRISAPIIALTEVTTRMAQGDLSSRTHVKSRDEIGQLAHSFNEMAAQVEATITMLHRFVSDAAHELQTPLTALYVDLDLAAQAHEAATQQGFVQRAQASALRLKSLTNQLLALSRLEAQAEPEPTEPLDLTNLLRQTAETYASQAEQAELNFSLQAPAEAVYIRAHLPQMRVVLDNLFDNACKFTPPGGNVTIQLQPSGAQVQLSVTDTGIGVPPDDLPLLFNRFHRSRNAANYPGSGLGLAIVKAIIEQQGGQVMVENSTPGTRFTLHWAALSGHG